MHLVTEPTECAFTAQGCATAIQGLTRRGTHDQWCDGMKAADWGHTALHDAFQQGGYLVNSSWGDEDASVAVSDDNTTPSTMRELSPPDDTGVTIQVDSSIAH